MNFANTDMPVQNQYNTYEKYGCILAFHYQLLLLNYLSLRTKAYIYIL